VHSVSNVREEITYICNCCTCACGILRGVVELGRADVVAHSPFINQVETDRCIGCEACLPLCQFGALSLQDGVVKIQAVRCAGCGLCIPACPEEALGLVRRPPGEVLPVPARETDWRALRAAARGIDPVQI
jgi:ferredoxin